MGTRFQSMARESMPFFALVALYRACVSSRLRHIRQHSCRVSRIDRVAGLLHPSFRGAYPKFREQSHSLLKRSARSSRSLTALATQREKRLLTILRSRSWSSAVCKSLSGSTGSIRNAIAHSSYSGAIRLTRRSLHLMNFSNAPNLLCTNMRPKRSWRSRVGPL